MSAEAGPTAAILARAAARPGAPRTEALGRCPLCLGRDLADAFSGSDRLHGVPGRFHYRRCRACDSVFQDPRVVGDELSACYPADYFTHEATGAAAPADAGPRPLGRSRERLRAALLAAMRGERPRGPLGVAARLMARSATLRDRAAYVELADFGACLAELLPPRGRTGRALDVGCGAGNQLRALARAGWDAEGVEWDPVAARAARETSGRPVHVGDFRELELPEAAYALVFLHHVFEHLDDPPAALRHIARLLAPGGRAVLVYPNPRSLGARLYGPDWFHWDVPRHLVLCPPEALAREAEPQGLRRLGLRTTARSATASLALSRGYARGRTPADAGTGTWRDRARGGFERLLVGLGLPLGEEAILTLGKDPAPAAPRPA
jgi:SAM-dependent methyltransferase